MGYFAVHRNKSDDELCHFKYIDKYYRNGKWNYVYETTQKNAKDAYNASRASKVAGYVKAVKDEKRAGRVRDNVAEKIQNNLDAKYSYDKKVASKGGSSSSGARVEKIAQKRVEALDKNDVRLSNSYKSVRKIHEGYGIEKDKYSDTALYKLDNAIKRQKRQGGIVRRVKRIISSR